MGWGWGGVGGGGGGGENEGGTPHRIILPKVSAMLFRVQTTRAVHIM